MDDVELLLCPFCGSPAFVADMRLFEDGNPAYIVHCRGCHAQTAPCSYPSIERSKAEAVHRWNQRVVVVDDGSMLLPCPCCGGDANVGHVDFASAQIRKFYGESYEDVAAVATGRYLVAAVCKTCGLLSKPFNCADYNRSKSEAVHVWNRRVGDVLTVPTKPDLSNRSVDPVLSAKPKPKSNPWVVLLAIFVIIIALRSIAGSLSLF